MPAPAVLFCRSGCRAGCCTKEMGSSRLEVHAEKATRSIAGCLFLLESLNCLGEITGSNVAVELNLHRLVDRLPQPGNHWLGEPVAGFGVEADLQITANGPTVSIIGDHGAFEPKPHPA